MRCRWSEVERQSELGYSPPKNPYLTYARDMVSLIPRLASFAVSGTPACSHVSDLNHVLK